jgi:hypothetical protein
MRSPRFSFAGGDAVGVCAGTQTKVSTNSTSSSAIRHAQEISGMVTRVSFFIRSIAGQNDYFGSRLGNYQRSAVRFATVENSRALDVPVRTGVALDKLNQEFQPATELSLFLDFL